MNEHAGPACALSGLIVGIFAVLLHDNNPPRPAQLPPVQGKSATSLEEGRPTIPEPASTPRPPVSGAIAASPRPASKVAELPPIASTSPAAREIPPARTEPRPEAAPAHARPLIPSAPLKKPSPPSPRPTFVVVEMGESLADVAARVYGSKDATQALWKANRDQVERVDSPLSRGTLLRVP